MSNKKPENIDEYKNWLIEEFEAEILDKTQTYYNSVTNKIEQNFKESNLWTQLIQELNEYNDEYLITTGYQLLSSDSKPKLVIKPFDSFILKTFRKNILENENWPSEPKDGWILPNNWFSKINDITRTLLIVKYLDGVEYMTNKVKSLCEQNNTKCNITLEAREEGYYAAHIYVKQEFEIPKIDWDTKKINAKVEIQITTQLQEVIRKLLHKYYEDRRKKIKGQEDIKWQWDYKSDEFATNYLGHILHYIEGMIMDIREK